MKALIIFLVLLPFDICAQAKIIIQGKVTEASTQESLVGGVVSVLKTNVFSITNEIGRYSLNLHKGTFKVLANYVGYNPDTIQIYLDKDTILNFSLQPITLSEVVVNGNRDNISDKIGTTSIPVLQLKSIPALLGEPDILRSLAMLPGVSNGVEGSVGLNVRGGSPEQNLILLDGATIYNAAHLFGFLSAFNTDAIKKVDLIKGGFPSQYGGRLSSVIDISFKDGNKERHSFEAGIGVLASKLLVEGPLKKNKVSYMIGNDMG